MLRWSLMLFVLSLVEGTSSHAAASTAIAKISFIMAVGLFIMFQRAHETHEDSERKT